MKRHLLLHRAWVLFLLAVGVLLLVLSLTGDASAAERYQGTAGLFLSLLAMAFFAEYVDSSLGMGYGTTLTPLLMLLGFPPLKIVPAILVSEFVTGLLAGISHHKAGNVNLKPATRAGRTALILACCSLVGTVAAVVLAVALPKTVVSLYIGLMIFGIGLYILLTRSGRSRFSWRKIIGLGSVAAFNKGISGGGYGPLVTGGQILAGVPEKHAVGITSMAESLVCVTGLVLYLILDTEIAWGLALPLTLGAVLSVPAAVYTVKVLPENVLRRSIGFATLYLGALTLLRVVL